MLISRRRKVNAKKDTDEEAMRSPNGYSVIIQRREKSRNEPDLRHTREKVAEKSR